MRQLPLRKQHPRHLVLDISAGLPLTQDCISLGIQASIFWYSGPYLPLPSDTFSWHQESDTGLGPPHLVVTWGL